MKCTFLLVPMFTTAAAAQSLVGTTLPPAPAGLVERVGACVAATLGSERECEYSIGILDDSNGVPKVVYAARLERRDDAQRPLWTVTASFPYPTLSQGQWLAVAECRIGNVPDQAIVAVVEADASKQWYDQVAFAKRLNLVTGRFDDVPVAGISCENVAWGL